MRSYASPEQIILQTAALRADRTPMNAGTGVFVLTEANALVPMQAASFASEDDFQRLCHVVERRTRRACISGNFKQPRLHRAMRSSPRRGRFGAFEQR